MDIFIMRHAQAVAAADRDSERALTHRGRQRASTMGRWLGRYAAEIAVILTSPALRCRETAELVAERLHLTAGPRVDERLAPGMEPATGSLVAHQVAAETGAVLLVGHEPDFGRLLAYLIGADAGTIRLKKGAVARITAHQAGSAGSILRWLVPPALCCGGHGQ